LHSAPAPELVTYLLERGWPGSKLWLAGKDCSCAPLRWASSLTLVNRRLAPDVYRDVVPLVHPTNGVTIGDIVDRFVVIDRLDERLMLDRVIAEKRLRRW
jgi:hypothetical protein